MPPHILTRDEVQAIRLLLADPERWTETELAFAADLLIGKYLSNGLTVHQAAERAAKVLRYLRPMLPKLKSGATFGHQDDDTVIDAQPEVSTHACA